MGLRYLWLVLAPISIATAQGGRASTTDVPVSNVMLFSSGVGYFEHSGSVRGNSATELRFKTSQINDILKSIVLQDQDGGRVGAITYPSLDPLAKTLKSFQVDIASNPSLAELLTQLRGARVTIQAQAERVSGTILGVEMRGRESEKGEVIQEPVLNLLAGAMIRAVDLRSISNLSLDDPQLQDELTKALSALVQARDQDKKPVTISFTGTGERRVRIGYVVETPVWKTSYRLLLEDKATTAKVQGWAIVENQTESDWNNVSLSLVSGRPISFTMDLYQPLYATRPNVVPEMFASLRPQLYEAATLDSVRSKTARAESPAAAPAPAFGAGGRGGAANDARRRGYNQLQEVVVTSTAMDAAASVEAVASAAKLGELFEYSVGNVTLARQKSAMLPIITDSVAVERLSIYNAEVLGKNPLTGVLLKNTTGKHLLQGPLTVLDKSSYAGDARIDNLPPGQERLLSYGIDLDVLVDNTKNRMTNAVTAARITSGTMTVMRKLVSSQEYAANNKSNHDKSLVIEHPFRPGWKLVDSPRPFETTPALYRFKTALAAGKVTALAVKEEQVLSESVSLLTVDVPALSAYSQTGEIAKDVRDVLTKVIQLKQAAIEIGRQIDAHSQEIASITAEQNRIRENMKTVAQNTQYYERLLAKLNEQESTIESLQKERDALTQRRDASRKELEDYLRDRTVG